MTLYRVASLAASLQSIPRCSAFICRDFFGCMRDPAVQEPGHVLLAAIIMLSNNTSISIKVEQFLHVSFFPDALFLAEMQIAK